MNPPIVLVVLLSIGVDRHVQVAPEIRLAAHERAPGDLLTLPSTLGRNLHAFGRDGDRVQLALKLQLALDRLVEFCSHSALCSLRKHLPHKSLYPSVSCYRPAKYTQTMALPSSCAPGGGL